jgi:gliding motility-associated protein GldL
MAQEKKKFKITLDSLISWGAVIVIIGLMAKLQHWPWGDWMIVAGLGTEAFLFFILGFQKQEDEVDWKRAYPELDPEYKGQVPLRSQALTTTASTGTTAALDKMLENAQITPDLIGKLGDGLRAFGQQVQSLQSVSDASIATTQFSESVKAATTGFHQLNASFSKATADLSQIANSSQDAATYSEQVSKLANNLQQINRLYELELRESEAKMKAVSAHYEQVAETLRHFNDSASETQQLKDQVNALNKNMTALNAVYTNMLAAMNQPRV